MDAAHPYEVTRGDGEVRVAVSGGVATFDAWHSSPRDYAARTAAPPTTSAPATSRHDVSTRDPGSSADQYRPSLRSRRCYTYRADAAPTREAAPNAGTTPDANITSNRAPSDVSAADVPLRLTSPTVVSEQPASQSPIRMRTSATSSPRSPPSPDAPSLSARTSGNDHRRDQEPAVGRRAPRDLFRDRALPQPKTDLPASSL